MSDQVPDNEQQDYSAEQTTEMLKSFQAAALAASDELLRLVSTLHYIYGAAVAGRGDTLKVALDGYDSRLMDNFEAVLAVFRQRGIPILEEYNDLLPFILETQAGVQMTLEEDNEGAYLRSILQTQGGDLSALLEKLLPVNKIIEQPKPKTGRKMGRPIDEINRYIGVRANALRDEHPVSWSKILDMLIVELSGKRRNPTEDRALQKLMSMKLRTDRRKVGTHLNQLAKYYRENPGDH